MNKIIIIELFKYIHINENKDINNIIYSINNLINIIKIISKNKIKIIIVYTGQYGKMMEYMYNQKESNTNFIFVNRSWLCGILTNYNQICIYILTLKKSHAFSLNKLYSTWYENYVGTNSSLEQYIINNSELPDLIIFFNPNQHLIALRESLICGIPTVGFVSDRKNIDSITYPIFGNFSNLYSHILIMILFKSLRN